MTYSLNLLFEELCLQMLLPRLEAPSIRWTAEYSEAMGQVMVRLEYNGGPFDIRTSGNELSLKLIQRIADIAEYEVREGEARANRVLLRVRKG